MAVDLDSLNFTKLKAFAIQKKLGIPGMAKLRAADVEKLRKEIKKRIGKKSPSPSKKSPKKASPKRKSPKKYSPGKQINLHSLGITKLKAMAKDLGITGLSKFKSADSNKIIKLIQKAMVSSPKKASPKRSPKKSSPKKDEWYRATFDYMKDMRIGHLKDAAEQLGITGLSKFSSKNKEELLHLILAKDAFRKRYPNLPRPRKSSPQTSPKNASPKRKASPKRSPKNASPKRKASPKRSPKKASPKKSMSSPSALRKLGITKLKAIAKDLGISGLSKFKSADVDKVVSLIMKAQGGKQLPAKEKKVIKAKKAVIEFIDLVDDIPPKLVSSANRFIDNVTDILEKKEKNVITKNVAKQQLQKSLTILRQGSSKRVVVEAEKVVNSISDVLDVEKQDSRSIRAQEYQNRSDSNVRNILDKGDMKYQDDEEYIEKLIDSLKSMTGESTVNVDASQLAQFKQQIKSCFANLN